MAEEIKTELIAIEQLTPDKRNARKHQSKDISAIIKSIEKYGFNDPVGVWGKNNLIVEGHGRVEAGKALGMTKVPCIRLDHLTPKQRREYAIMHNKTAELSEWDYTILGDELQELELDDFGDIFGDVVSPDDFKEDFTLPSGEKSEFCQMTFTLHNRQAELIKEALKKVKDDIFETFGNENSNGNALYEVVRQWDEQRT